MTPQKLASCSLCGEEIYESDTHMMYRQIVGWERARGRRGGGTNALKIRRETGALAHGRCVEEGASKAKRGIAVNQGGLF